MSESFMGGVGGKKTASGTFVGDGFSSSQQISLDFTPGFVSCHLQSTVQTSSSIGDCTRVMSFDFTTNKGFTAYRELSSDGQTNLGYSGYSGGRPTFLNGTLSFAGRWKSGATYTWFVEEA